MHLTDKIKQILKNYESESPAVKSNIVKRVGSQTLSWGTAFVLLTYAPNILDMAWSDDNIHSNFCMFSWSFFLNQFIFYKHDMVSSDYSFSVQHTWHSG